MTEKMFTGTLNKNQNKTKQFYIVKLGFTGVYIFILFLLQNRDCGYSMGRLELLSTIYVLSKKNITILHLKIIIFTAVKNRSILNTSNCEQEWPLQTLILQATFSSN